MAKPRRFFFICNQVLFPFYEVHVFEKNFLFLSKHHIIIFFLIRINKTDIHSRIKVYVVSFNLFN